MWAAVLSKLGAFFVGIFTAVFGSWKSILLVTFFAFLSIEIYNFICGIIEELLNYVVSSMSSVSMPEGATNTFTFSGVAGWFMSSLKIPECMSFIVSMVMLKWTLRKIPFVRW